MSARDDNNFLEMLRALPVRGATPRVVDLRDAYPPVEVYVKASRRRQGLSRKVRDAAVMRRVASLVARTR